MGAHNGVFISVNTLYVHEMCRKANSYPQWSDISSTMGYTIDPRGVSTLLSHTHHRGGGNLG